MPRRVCGNEGGLRQRERDGSGIGMRLMLEEVEGGGVVSRVERARFTTCPVVCGGDLKAAADCGLNIFS